MKRVISTSQERGTVETFRNRRNPNKYIEVKKANDGHSYARQYMKWDTPEGEVKNYTGAKDAKRGRYHRSTRQTIDQMLEDYDSVTSSTSAGIEYTFYFGDGSSAASRGSEPENACEVSLVVESDSVANGAVLMLLELEDDFTSDDVRLVLENQGYSEDEIEDIFSMSLEDAISELDITGGDPLVYKVERNGKVVYYDADMEAEVLGED